MPESQADFTKDSVVYRALERERERRSLAEHLLEEKSRDLYASYKKLELTLEQLKSSQKQLVQFEKMASLGIMSAGVAHEINNPVGFVISNLNTLSEYTQVYLRSMDLLKKLHDSIEDGSDLYVSKTEIAQHLKDSDVEYLLEDTQNLLSETQEGLHRIKDIVSGLRTFARADDSGEELFSLAECITSTLPLVDRKINDSCIVKTDLLSTRLIKGNPGRISQVLVNLLINASQAIDREADDGKITILCFDRGDQVLVTIEDNGSGIAQENIEKLFTPFFTTKPVGKGTGLGLSISFGIIQDHNGAIDVESSLGEYTRFTISFPAADNQH